MRTWAWAIAEETVCSSINGPSAQTSLAHVGEEVVEAAVLVGEQGVVLRRLEPGPGAGLHPPDGALEVALADGARRPRGDGVLQDGLGRRLAHQADVGTRVAVCPCRQPVEVEVLGRP